MPNPLSETQARQVREYVDEAIRRQLRPWKIYGVAVVVGLFLGALGGVWIYTTTFGYARNVSCQRGRAVSLALNLVVHSAIPRHRAGRSVDEQRQVDAFYRKVGPGLQVPSCN